ncbi:hypothetical protein OC834_006186 [Tilletia horrida]|uniref:Chitin deacetylase n=1 Tax=Tilletia horrida TaxID=155126 RepID=A0AAN6GFM1_9BASI|nr:hypothetical protein OC835_007464 [Tilletia horrida]KAK0522685.1 hypothetical protein OC834_006186 [Tilletia horrida]KAK0534337.1 hypothetical protein OC842_002677 [Tilletia horrida]KAK0554924.1 hypothetical protein OC844_006113 [Tilletia horrida]
MRLFTTALAVAATFAASAVASPSSAAAAASHAGAGGLLHKRTPEPAPAPAPAPEPVPEHNLLHEGCRPIDKRTGTHAHPALHRRQTPSGAGEGSSVGQSAGASGAGYSCDPNQCKLPNCHCASTSPPGGLSPADTPQFIVFTADDAIQTYTVNAVNGFLQQRKNPNGCTPQMSYYTSLSYTNYFNVTSLAVQYNYEIADHTMTHVGDPPTNEVSGNLQAINSLAGIPYSAIQGFRAPFLNYSVNTLKMLKQMQFEYDTSATSSIPVTDPNTDAFWPYTLDNGMANDCLAVEGICQGQPKLPGLWEVPMYAIFDERGAAGAHLMDPWLDSPNANDVLKWMQNTFLDHYNGNRQPFGLYSHPIHVATGYPGLPDPTAQINMINRFLDWATTNSSMQNVWIVSNRQLLAWMKNPVPASQLNTLDAFKCGTPQVGHICNGQLANSDLIEHCISDTPGDALNQAPFYTCYGCPTTTPTPDQPMPPQKNNDNTLRTRISNTCSTAWWDPIAAKCLCNGSNCAFSDGTRAIGPNGQNLTSSPVTNADGDTGSATTTRDPYTQWNTAPPSARTVSGLVSVIVAVGLVAVFGSVAL